MDAEVLVIGAGPAGLAVAATLKRKGRRPLVIEKATQVGASWRNHYERLHLHTVKALSALPGLPFPDDAPRYVPRQGVVDYLAAYAARAGIEPCFGEEATAIVPRRSAAAGAPRRAPGRRFASRRRRRHHRREQPSVRADDRRRGALRPAGGSCTAATTATPRRSRASACSSSAWATPAPRSPSISPSTASRVALSVRSPVNIVHRDVLGRPTQQTSILLGAPADADRRRAGAPAVRRHGRRHRPLRPAALARVAAAPAARARPNAGDRRRHAGAHQVGRDRRLSRRSAASSQAAPSSSTGARAKFDAIVLATGYRAGVAALFPASAVPVDDSGLPTQLAGTRRARRRLLRRLRPAPARRPAAHDRRAGARGRRADRRVAGAPAHVLIGALSAPD